MTRRTFLAQAAAAANPWDSPIFDLHQHTDYYRRTDDQLLAHSRALGVTKTLLLPGDGWMFTIPLQDNASCRKLQDRHPTHFVRFTCIDPTRPGAIELMRKDLQSGAIGIGEQKFRVPVDGPQMRAVYDLAREFSVPVLIHFEHETYNLGIENFEKILKAYPTVNFIGHAQTWWGNISADLQPKNLYPKGKVAPGGLTDRLLADYSNLFADLSAGSGFNALSRDPDFAAGFVSRHRAKLIWGSDCPCHDSRGGGWRGGDCVGRDCLAALKRLAPSPAAFRQIVWDNGARLLNL
ncbi:MAG: amidohydrolase [Acidobacteria bacterium]|nr:amidohydrolase [Acidobacteriota bacterium]